MRIRIQVMAYNIISLQKKTLLVYELATSRLTYIYIIYIYLMECLFIRKIAMYVCLTKPKLPTFFTNISR